MEGLYGMSIDEWLRSGNERKKRVSNMIFKTLQEHMKERGSIEMYVPPHCKKAYVTRPYRDDPVPAPMAWERMSKAQRKKRKARVLQE